MTYNTLERTTRQAVCNIFGAISDNRKQGTEPYNRDNITENEASGKIRPFIHHFED